MDKVFNMLRVASEELSLRKRCEYYRSLSQRLLKLEGTKLYLQLQSLLVMLSDLNYNVLESSFIDYLSDLYSSRIRKVQRYVEDNYHRKRLRELAELVNMTEQSFSRFFKKIMGRPFFTFLNQYRINIAKRMLLDSDWSIREICFACGYESVPFFHRTFLKLVGSTPLKFRLLNET